MTNLINSINNIITNILFMLDNCLSTAFKHIYEYNHLLDHKISMFNSLKHIYLFGFGSVF